MNPLFTLDDDEPKKASKKDAGYLMPNRHGRKIQPLHDDLKPQNTGHTPHMPGVDTPTKDTKAHHSHAEIDHTVEGANPAVDLIRRKLEAMYAFEPEAKQEQKIVASEQPVARSKHEQFMHQLSTSGKSLAQIQTEWHAYYVSLPDEEKHQVWQEFYSHNSRQQPASVIQPSVQAQATPQAQMHTDIDTPVATPAQPTMPAQPSHTDPLQTATNMVVVSQPTPEEQETATKPAANGSKAKAKASEVHKKGKAALKRQIEKRVNLSAAKQAKAMQHFKSLMFGIGSGLLVLLIVLFGLFNEMVIAPFIQPSNKAGATPIILNTDGIAPSSTPEVIIPKINVQIPTDYSLTSNSEEEVQKGLEGGIVHYPTTVRPGQKGNAAYFGHSSNNIFNPGKYKFAFVKLHELVPGDIFYLTYEGKVYSYKVFDKQIVSPDQVSVLNNVEGKAATATLITCDPPGTALNRLVVWGEQISPDPNTAVDATPAQSSETVAEKQQLSGNGPSLWSRLTGWLTGN